jgi:hypothetical protein
MVTRYDLVPSPRFLREFIANVLRATGLESSGEVFRGQTRPSRLPLQLRWGCRAYSREFRRKGASIGIVDPLTVFALPCREDSRFPQNPRDLTAFWSCVETSIPFGCSAWDTGWDTFSFKPGTVWPGTIALCCPLEFQELPGDNGASLENNFQIE